MNPYQFKLGLHRQQEVVWVAFAKSEALLAQLKGHFLMKWSASQVSWYFLKNQQSLQVLWREFGIDFTKNQHDNAAVESQASQKAQSLLCPANQVALQRFLDELKLKAYSSNTVKTYKTEFLHLLNLLKNHPVSELSQERLRAYFLYCAHELV